MTNIDAKALKIESQHPEAWVPFRLTSPKQPLRGCFRRSLELRGLELTVKDWTNISLTEGYNSPTVQAILTRHARDEDAHDRQMEMLSDWAGVDGVSPEAKSLMDDWENLQVDPMVKKLCLEAGVFFQLLGCWHKYVSNPEVATIRGWIMGDEATHVAIARLLVSHRQLTIPKEAMQLVIKTLQWVFSDPEDELTLWGKIAYGTLIRGEGGVDATGMSSAPVPEFFTQGRNQHIPYLARA